MTLSIDAAERGLVPDMLIRQGIRQLLRHRLNEEERGNGEARQERLRRFLAMLRTSPLALATSAANQQHYEVPPAFFRLVLGPRLKYSSCLFTRDDQSLAEAEEAMLQLTCQRAELTDGMDILELGCGWGSLTFWMAEQYPHCTITAVTNSRLQQDYITTEYTRRGISTIRVIKADMNDFQPTDRYDRVVSVEMFEHMRNYRELLARIARWLKPAGRLFVHIFCHARHAYLFQEEGADNWMGRHFFSGGMMPSNILLAYFQEHLLLEDHWQVSGEHYRRTAEAWLHNLDKHYGEVLSVLSEMEGEGYGERQVQRWRMFFMACAELWGFRQGNEWHVAHYRFRQRED